MKTQISFIPWQLIRRIPGKKLYIYEIENLNEGKMYDIH